MKNTFFLLLFVVCSIPQIIAQGTVTGKIIDGKTREVLPYVSIVILNTQKGATSAEDGTFVINNAPFGYVKLQASFIGYKTVVSESYLVTNEKSPYVILELFERAASLDEVVVRSRLFKKSLTSPLSKQTLSIVEIEKNPGGNRDVLKVLQSLPGVASNPGFRNDIIIRGGATSENKFYIDGIEVPVINHFQTQGATGGPVGLINADLIRNVDFYTSAFPSNRGNALSSVIEFSQKKGNPNALNTRASLGTSDAGITLDGPLGKNTTFMASLRQSYLQFLFKLLKLPFLPTYTDFQLHVNSRISENNELAVLMIGAVDEFNLNEEVNDAVTDVETFKRNQYALSNIPEQDQWNYTIGTTLKHYADNSNQLYVLSRSVLNNNAIKYYENTGLSSDLLLDYTSKEIENKFRFENNTSMDDFNISFGVGVEQSTYETMTFQKIVNNQSAEVRDFSSNLDLFKYGVFGQVSKEYLDAKLGLSFGFRLDGNNYNDSMRNLFHQFSPRLSVSYALSNAWSWNSSVGTYYQLPSYTTMGFRDNAGSLVNRENLKYIKSNHFVSGFEIRPNSSAKITLEGFYKTYDRYPFSVRNQISLANLGADFGVVGSEAVTSTSKGRAYGFEVLAQKKSYKGLYGIVSYTFVRSEFENQLQEYVSSSWDNQHLLSVTAGKKLKSNWEIGAKFRLVGGKPYTPYDLDASAVISNYDIANEGILDYTKLNSERFGTYTQLDFRIDKTWFWKKMALNFYIDVQNMFSSQAESQALLLPTLDANGTKIIDPSNANKYVLEQIDNTNGNVLPGFGFIVDF